MNSCFGARAANGIDKLIVVELTRHTRGGICAGRMPCSMIVRANNLRTPGNRRIRRHYFLAPCATIDHCCPEVLILVGSYTVSFRVGVCMSKTPALRVILHSA